MVTRHPVKSNASSNKGIATISLCFSLTFSCPRLIPLAVAQALTIWSLNPGFPAGWEEVHLLAPRMVLPSMATTPSYFSQISNIQCRKIRSKYSGFRALKKRLKVSWLGMDSNPGRRSRKSQSWHCRNPLSHTRTPRHI